jgi:hypothetical protein
MCHISDVGNENNKNLIQEEIKWRLNFDNLYYHSIQKRLSSCPLFKNAKIRIHKTIILTAVLLECET